MHAAMQQHQSEAGAAGIYAVPWQQQTKESTIVGALETQICKDRKQQATHNMSSHRLLTRLRV
jgi:hypothetical protein